LKIQWPNRKRLPGSLVKIILCEHKYKENGEWVYGCGFVLERE